MGFREWSVSRFYGYDSVFVSWIYSFEGVFYDVNKVRVRGYSGKLIKYLWGFRIFCFFVVGLFVT